VRLRGRGRAGEDESGSKAGSREAADFLRAGAGKASMLCSAGLGDMFLVGCKTKARAPLVQGVPVRSRVWGDSHVTDVKEADNYAG
jgi:hypothetical protein